MILPLFDHPHLAEFSGGDRALEHDFVSAFRDNASLYLETLKHAADAPAFAAEAHRLKGAARAIGAKRLAALAEVAEKEGKAGAGAAERSGLAVALGALFAETSAHLDEVYP